MDDMMEQSDEHTSSSSFPDSSDSTEPRTRKEIISAFLKNITIEPMMLVHMIGMSSSSIVVQNLYIDRICRVTHGISPDKCLQLTEYKLLETEVEATASLYTTYRGLLEAGFPIIFSLFLGPWTDKHGTKYPILLPFLGYFLSALIYLTLTFVPDLPPAFILFASIPVAMSGGLVAMIMSVFSFMSKITSLENRSFRVAMLEGSWFLGGPIGLVLGGYIYKYGDFRPVFIFSGSLYLGALLYGVLFVKFDKPEIPEEQVSSCCADMFNVTAVKDIFATIFRERPGKTRRWILVMLLAICLRIFAMMGYLNTMYLYTRNRFGWQLKDYTEFSVADSFIAITGSYIMIMITMKIFKLNDAVIGILGSVGSVIGSIIFASSVKGWMVYLGAAISMFAGLISIVIRAMLSKVVAKEEIAKVYTFLACGEASMPLIAVPLYNLLFISTNSFFPSAVFVLSTGVYSLVLLSFIYLYFSMKSQTVHVQMDDSGEIGNESNSDNNA